MVADYVTKIACNKTHKFTSGVITVIMLLVGTIVVLCGWSLLDAKSATKAANDASANLSTHAARQKGSLETIDAKLAGITDAQKKIEERSKSTEAMVHDLWKRDRGTE